MSNEKRLASIRTEEQALSDALWAQSANPGLRPLIERIEGDLQLLKLLACSKDSRPVEVAGR